MEQILEKSFTIKEEYKNIKKLIFDKEYFKALKLLEINKNNLNFVKCLIDKHNLNDHLMKI